VIKKEDINIDIEIPKILDLRDETKVSKKKISKKSNSKEDKLNSKKVKKIKK